MWTWVDLSYVESVSAMWLWKFCSLPQFFWDGQSRYCRLCNRCIIWNIIFSVTVNFFLSGKSVTNPFIGFSHKFPYDLSSKSQEYFSNLCRLILTPHSKVEKCSWFRLHRSTCESSRINKFSWKASYLIYCTFKSLYHTDVLSKAYFGVKKSFWSFIIR